MNSTTAKAQLSHYLTASFTMYFFPFSAVG